MKLLSDILKLRQRRYIIDCHKDEWRERQKGKILIESLTLLDDMVYEKYDCHIWNKRWLKHEGLLNYINSFVITNDEEANICFDWCVNLLDLFQLSLEISDFVEWKKSYEEESAKRDEEIVWLSKVNNEAMRFMLTEDKKELGSLMFKEYDERLGKLLRETNEHIQILNRKLFANRGKASKRGYLVKALDSFIDSDYQNRAAFIADLLTQLGGIETTRQQVTSLIKGGKT